MSRLASTISEAIISEFGKQEFLARLADPFFFQSFGCLLGFDWHSSGLTTTVCGALKEALARRPSLGIVVCGGKGAISRKTPSEILAAGGSEELVRASKLAAKVDNAALQDGYQLYHHTFIFTRSGEFAVIQQGMHERASRARRYHWLSTQLESFVDEPHSGIASRRQESAVLNMVAHESLAARDASLELATRKPELVLKTLQRVEQLTLPVQFQVKLLRKESLKKTLLTTYEHKPQTYENLLLIRGVGPKTIRALALTAELIYGSKASWRDPATYSFAHGGKDGTPYPVDRKTYDRTIDVLERAVRAADLGRPERLDALRRLKA